MQKKIIALAVAGLSTAAFAQTNVTIYGVADVSFQGQNVSKGVAQGGDNTYAQGSQAKIGNNSSLIGFKGTEALGNGLTGLFQFETNVNANGSTNGTTAVATTNSTFGSARDSYVGLSSKYGTTLGGYLTTPYRATLTSFDVMPGATGDGRLENLLGKQYYGATQLNSSVRASAIAYAMPTLYGFNGTIAYTGNGGNNLTTNQVGFNNAMSFNLGWTGYGVNLAGAFIQSKYTNAATTSTSVSTAGVVSGTYTAPAAFGNYTSYLVGASYTGMPGLKLAVTYGRNTLGTNDTATTGAQKGSNNTVSVGASYRMGNWEPRLQYAQVSSTSGITGQGSNGASQYTANVGYYLSKRTQVYGLISGLNNNNNAQYNFLNATGATGSAVSGTTMLTYGMGLRTNF